MEIVRLVGQMLQAAVWKCNWRDAMRGSEKAENAGHCLGRADCGRTSRMSRRRSSGEWAGERLWKMLISGSVVVEQTDVVVLLQNGNKEPWSSDNKLSSWQVA